MFKKILLLILNIHLISITNGLQVNYKNLDKYIIVALKNGNLQDAIELAKENHYHLIGQV